MIQALRLLQWALFVVFLLTFYLAVAEIFKLNTVMVRFNCEHPVYDGKESFDGSLQRLNSMAKVEKYCDSISAAEGNDTRNGFDPGKYALTVSEVIQKKFYHGFSCYGFSNNYLALLSARILNNHLDAIVLPNEIVKYPYAACSQQAIVAMDLLTRKNITTRKVGFRAGTGYDGHFCFEAYYNDKWHFFDTDLEPDSNQLSLSGNPDIATLAKNDSLLLKAYPRLTAYKTLNLFKNYFYGEPNVPLAPNATIVQRLTNILSYIFWVLPLTAFLLCRRTYLRFQAHKKCAEFQGLSQLA
jgi:hypothetical protein